MSEKENGYLDEAIREAECHIKNLGYADLKQLDKGLGIIHEYLPEFWSESGCRDIQIINTKLIRRINDT